MKGNLGHGGKGVRGRGRAGESITRATSNLALQLVFRLVAAAAAVRTSFFTIIIFSGQRDVTRRYARRGDYFNTKQSASACSLDCVIPRPSRRWLTNETRWNIGGEEQRKRDEHEVTKYITMECFHYGQQTEWYHRVSGGFENLKKLGNSKKRLGNSKRKVIGNSKRKVGEFKEKVREFQAKVRRFKGKTRKFKEKVRKFKEKVREFKEKVKELKGKVRKIVRTTLGGVFPKLRKFFIWPVFLPKNVIELKTQVSFYSLWVLLTSKYSSAEWRALRCLDESAIILNLRKMIDKLGVRIEYLNSRFFTTTLNGNISIICASQLV